MQVTMRNFKSSDDQGNTITMEKLLLSLGNALCDGKAMLGYDIWQICPLINLHSWNDKKMSAGNWVNGHEGDANLIGIDKCAGQFASNDASKY